MRSRLVPLACAAALCAAAGCSDDNTCAPCAPVVSDRPLAQFSHSAGGGLIVDIGDTLRVNFVSSSADTLFDLFLTAADDSTIRVIGSKTYRPFAAAAARLSDGVDDQWTYRITSVKYGWLMYTQPVESVWLQGGFTGEYTPDLHGATITRAWIYLNEVTINPGASYSSYTVHLRVVLMGTT